MGNSLLVGIDSAHRSEASATGQQTAEVGFHIRDGYPFACNLLLERRTGWKTLEQRRRQLTRLARSADAHADSE
jgi:hypothetical protein